MSKKSVPDFDYTPGGNGQKVDFDSDVPTISVYTQEQIPTKEYKIGEKDPSSGKPLHGSVVVLDGNGNKVRFMHRPKGYK